MATTIWNLREAKRRHRHSPGVAEALGKILPLDEPVLDLGCGVGSYLAYLAGKGYECLGIEGTPGIREIALFPNIVEADLSQPLAISWARSSVICLEVGEHLLVSQEDQLVTTIDRYCRRWLVISWAVPGQKGHGHNNCRSNEYVRARFEAYGFELDSESTRFVREVVEEHTKYFRNTLQVLQRAAL